MEKTNFTFIAVPRWGKASTKFARCWAVLLAIGLFGSYQLSATTCPNATAISALPFTGTPVCGGNDITSTNASVCSPVTSSYYGGNEALFTFTPASNMEINVAYSGQTWTQISIYNGCPTSGGTCVAGISSSASSKNVNGMLVGGNTYFILIDTWPDPTSPCPGTVTVTAVGPPPPPPANDDCATAAAVALNTSVSGNTTTATDSNPPTCGVAGDGTGGGLWYTVEGTGLDITASLCGSGFDTQLAVYSGSCGGLVCEADNDDFCSTQSEVTWLSDAGVTYYMYVDGFSTATGAFTLNVNGLVPPPTGGDPCDDDQWAPIIVYPSQDIVVTLDPCAPSMAIVSFEVGVTDNCDGDYFPAAPGDPVVPGSEFTVTAFSGPDLTTVFSAGGDRFTGVFEPGTYQVQISAEDLSGNFRDEDFLITVLQDDPRPTNLICNSVVNATLNAD
ncbi:MAG: hypothetical protein KDD28_18440, partial [Phaeodactylibacter sp.]|nr:hypothetical protein [Phaeodactylibacter sp.]